MFDFEAWTASDSTQAHSSTSTTGTAYRKSLTHREGDWECSRCGNLNFANRLRCNKCSNPKTEDAKADFVNHTDDASQAGPHGLFKKGDWMCTHCGNVNWARRPKCNVCNAPKVTTTEKPRTGRGGGHYDLQDPQDRYHYQSDDEEYDEFGRKKKKRKQQEQNHTSASNQKSADDAPIQLCFPPPLPCYLAGRTLSMSSVSSHSSDYTEASAGRNASMPCGWHLIQRSDGFFLIEVNATLVFATFLASREKPYLQATLAPFNKEPFQVPS